MTFHASRPASDRRTPDVTQRTYHLFGPLGGGDDYFHPSSGLMRADCRMWTPVSARLAVIATAAILAACVSALALAVPLPPLAKPMTVRFQLADGVRVAGEMTSCDDAGFDGSFGRRLWTELTLEDAWNLHQRVMDQQAAADWINLGRVMLLLSSKQKPAANRAETAFRRAVQLDPASKDEIDRVKDGVAQARKAERDAQRRAESEKLTTLSPESGPTMQPGNPWPATVWPALSEEEQAAAVLAMKADAANVLKQAGVTIAPAETAHFIVYSELERSETAEWALRLEKILSGLEFVLNPGVDPAAKSKPLQIQPWGKVNVFIWKEQDRFKMVEAESFRHLVPNSAIAVSHYTGPKASINCWRDLDDEAFEWALITETVHALMHRCGSPRRLPAWANDGLAELIASRAGKHSNLGRDRRKQALEFIRQNGNINAVLDLKYEDASFPGPDGIGSPVGGLLIELMLNEKPARLVQWIARIKTGKDWTAALKEDYGSTREEVVGIAAQFYKVNN